MCNMIDNLMNVTRNSTFDIFKYIEQRSDEELAAEERKDLILIASYSVLIVVSLIGNVIVCKVVYDLRQSLSTTNVLIFNLAVSDLLMTAVNIPFNLMRFIMADWPFGHFLCMFVPFVQSMSVHSSSITMMFIAFERYKSLIHNSHIDCKCLGERFRFVGILFFIWLLSAVFSIPHGIHNKIRRLFMGLEIIRCRVIYPEPKDMYNMWYTIISLMTQYLIPITLTLICYVRISQFLWRRQIVGTVNELHRICIMRKKKRRIRMLLTVVVVFAICWLPLNIYLLINAFKPQYFKEIAFFSCHWFAMSSVCYNPFIYCWLNENFRRRFKKLIAWCCWCSHVAVGRNGDSSFGHSQQLDGNSILTDSNRNENRPSAETNGKICSPNTQTTNLSNNSPTTNDETFV